MADIPINSKGSMSTEPSNSETEATSIMESHSPDNSSFHLTVEKLNGRNYRKWAQSIKLIIDGKGRIGYITGETKKPTDPVLSKKWSSENSMVTS